MSRNDEVARRAGPPGGPFYDAFHATVVDGIRYGTSGVQSARTAAEETLVRLRSGPRPLLGRPGPGEALLVAAVAAVVERGTGEELPTDDVAHAALDALRGLGVAIPPRGPDDPFPDLGLDPDPDPE